MKQIHSHIIKLMGRAELPQELKMGINYHVSLSGAVPNIQVHDNEDGSVDAVYAFKPIKVELLDELGTSIPAKDTRSDSQLLRNLLYKHWVNAASQIEFEDFRHKFMMGIMRDILELIDRYE